MDATNFRLMYEIKTIKSHYPMVLRLFISIINMLLPDWNPCSGGTFFHPSSFLTKGFVKQRLSHYKAASLRTGAFRGGWNRNVRMLVKLRSDVYVRILSVELMVTQGRDRYCQKVTRRQGNGLGPPTSPHGLMETRGAKKGWKDTKRGQSRKQSDDFPLYKMRSILWI